MMFVHYMISKKREKKLLNSYPKNYCHNLTPENETIFLTTLNVKCFISLLQLLASEAALSQWS